MNKDEILSEIQKIISELLRTDIDITYETIAKDVEGWDSLRHIAIISAVEKQFQIKFKMKDIVGMKNIGDMVEIILKNI